MGMAEIKIEPPKIWAKLSCGREVRVPITTQLGAMIPCRPHDMANRPSECSVRSLSNSCEKERAKRDDP